MKSLGRSAIAALALAAAAGCARTRIEQAAPAPGAAPDWRLVATVADRARIRSWRGAFVEGLAEARAGGHGAAIAAEGRLLDPDAGSGERPQPGDWRCRVIKLGAQGRGGLAYVAYPAFDCRIDQEGRLASFRKLTGSQRPVGVILDGGPMGKPVFLGTLMLGDERRAIDYGQDPDRDMAGLFERVEPRRWRLILPRPRFESVIDVIELVPAG